MPSAETKNPPSDIALDLSDIQGIIASGYGHLSHSRYLFLQIEEASKAKGWLRSLLRDRHITSSLWGEKPPTAVNLAVTYAGLQALEAPAELLQSFSKEFIEGMTEPNRTRQLGDFGINAPDRWEQPWQPDTTVDLLLILQATAADLGALDDAYRAQLGPNGLKLLAVETGYIPVDSREHFGFHDSISQPAIEGSPKAEKTRINAQDLIKAGEFILGYLNEDGNYPSTPTVPVAQDPTHSLSLLPQTALKDFGRNGSYLVYRKIAQDVAGFRRYFQDTFSTPEERLLMMSKIVGRWPSGAPLVQAPDADPLGDRLPDNDFLANSNDFAYGPEDPQGFRCPFSSHIRRTNPRDSLGQDASESIKSSRRRRLLRRGAVYGDPLPEGVIEDDGQPRGLLFFCINANIRRQFEFVQQSWVNAPTFNGLYDERDPLVGYNPDGSLRTAIVPKEPLSQSLSLPNFVTLKGGAYFFLPSLSALTFLATE
ncbi:Dyp-type peroxidase [Altericista sp. CCNU0014]|uniref:Dyp-type peroxidase n=1 Tax=Altericista sp. CCNU0014 TaxID=3082949 RepID=UPI00384BC899